MRMTPNKNRASVVLLISRLTCLKRAPTAQVSVETYFLGGIGTFEDCVAYLGTFRKCLRGHALDRNGLAGHRVCFTLQGVWVCLCVCVCAFPFVEVGNQATPSFNRKAISFSNEISC